jgi:hypothetical protein
MSNMSTLAEAPTGPAAPKEGDVRNWAISVTQGCRGWFAVMIAEFFDSEIKEWVPEPESSGINSFSNRDGAVADAKRWAEDEGLPFRETW